MNYAERKAQRSRAYQERLGKKTGDLVELAEVRLFYQTEAPEAQEVIESQQRELEIKNYLGEANKYYLDDC